MGTAVCFSEQYGSRYSGHTCTNVRGKHGRPHLPMFNAGNTLCKLIISSAIVHFARLAASRFFPWRGPQGGGVDSTMQALAPPGLRSTCSRWLKSRVPATQKTTQGMGPHFRKTIQGLGNLPRSSCFSRLITVFREDGNGSNGGTGRDGKTAVKMAPPSRPAYKLPDRRHLPPCPADIISPVRNSRPVPP